AGAIIVVYVVDNQDQRHEIGTATADANGVWSTTIDPKDPNLGDGTFTLIATTQVGEGDPVDTNTIQVTIDCCATRVRPVGRLSCCGGEFEISGDFAGAGAS